MKNKFVKYILSVAVASCMTGCFDLDHEEFYNIDADGFPDLQIQRHLDRGARFDRHRLAPAGSRIAPHARFPVYDFQFDEVRQHDGDWPVLVNEDLGDHVFFE